MADELTPSPSAYEFTPAQGEVIGGLGRSMRIIGLITLAYSIAGLILMAIVTWKTKVLALDLNPILGLFIGGWGLSVAPSFLDVAGTQGNDIPHLMEALGKLRSIFTLIAILLVLALVLAIIVLGVIAFMQPEGTSVRIFGHPIG